MRMLSVRHVLPSRKVSNEELIEHAVAHEENRIPRAQHAAFRHILHRYLERCGAVERHHRATGERALNLGVAAGQRALSSAGVPADEIDLLIYVGVARGFLEPATANVFQAALGLSKATCFDILDACVSWLRAVDVARHFLRLGTYRRVMILNCEFNFAEYVRFDFRLPADLAHLGAGLTIGEAATAVILEDGGDDDYHAAFWTSGAHHHLCQIPLPGARQFDVSQHNGDHPSGRFYAYASPLHRAAIDQLVQQYHSDSRWRRERPDIVFGHAPSVPAAETALERLEIDPSYYVNTFPAYGNTVSASVPLGMSLAAEEGRLQRGMQVLIVVASAGVSTAFCRFTY